MRAILYLFGTISPTYCLVISCLPSDVRNSGNEETFLILSALRLYKLRFFIHEIIESVACTWEWKYFILSYRYSYIIYKAKVRPYLQSLIFHEVVLSTLVEYINQSIYNSYARLIFYIRSLSFFFSRAEVCETVHIVSVLKYNIYILIFSFSYSLFLFSHFPGFSVSTCRLPTFSLWSL